MYQKPSELCLHALDSIVPGTLIQLAGRADDIPYAVKLRSTDGNGSRILLLGGDYSFEDANWSSGVQLATIVCDADKLLVALGSVDEENSHLFTGAILVHEGGAVLNATRDRRYHQPIDLSTWGDADRGRPRDHALLYTTWKFGYLDGKCDFVSVYENTRGCS